MTAGKRQVCAFWMNKAAHDRIGEIADAAGMSMGEVLEELVAQIDLQEELAPRLVMKLRQPSALTAE